MYAIRSYYAMPWKRQPPGLKSPGPSDSDYGGLESSTPLLWALSMPGEADLTCHVDFVAMASYNFV